MNELQGHVDLRVIPPVCPLDVSPADFSHGGELIELARAGASHWLESIGLEPHSGDLELHRH